MNDPTHNGNRNGYTSLYRKAEAILHEQQTKRHIANPTAYIEALIANWKYDAFETQQQQQVNDPAWRAVRNCTNCDHNGLAWYTRTSQPSHRQDPAAAVAEKCEHQ